MATTITTPTMPTVGGSDGTWGTTVNAAVTTLVANDTALKSTADGALPLAGGTMTGTVKTLTSAATRVDKGSVSGTVAFDLSAGNAFTLTVGGTSTFSAPTNCPSGTMVNWMLWRMTNAGASTITWNTAYKFPGGTKPTFTSSGKDDLAWVSWDAGTTWELVGHELDLK